MPRTKGSANKAKPSVQTPFVIVSDIPIPPKRGENTSKLRTCLSALKQNQSFLVPNDSSRFTLKTLINQQKGQFTTEKQKDGSIRVWKR